MTAEIPTDELDDAQMDFNKIAFTDGGDYGVVLDEDADYEVSGDTVFFDEADAIYMNDTWTPNGSYDTAKDGALHFNSVVVGGGTRAMRRAIGLEE